MCIRDSLSSSGDTYNDQCKFSVGTNRGGNQFIDGWIGEILCFNEDSSGLRIDRGNRYLMGKWGVDPLLEDSNTYNDAHAVGGSGSGGSIYLKAPNLVINSGVTISANGGTAAPVIDQGGNTGATDGGGEGPAAGGGGRVFLEGTTSFVNHASPTNANISANGGQSQVKSGAGTARHGEDGTCLLYTSPSPRDS